MQNPPRPKLSLVDAVRLMNARTPVLGRLGMSQQELLIRATQPEFATAKEKAETPKKSLEARLLEARRKRLAAKKK